MKKIDKKDALYATAKAVVGSIPLAGAAAAELLGLLVASPLEKRRETFLTEVSERLRVLEQKKEINLADLQNNEQFVDTVLQAVSLALKTSDQEKITAFRNTILNTATGDAPDEIKSQVFLNCIDRFTSWHIRVLNLFENPLRWFEQRGKQPPRFLMGALRNVVLAAFPELQDESELLDVLWNDLYRAGFHKTSDLNTTMSGDGTLANRTSELGKEFLGFIRRAD